ncbi:MAG: helix-turn-helix transcriptional regulator [Gemella haemolysans]|nr:helix-turn-helix transcriptional regulator [Gemella haemolysans]
MLDKELKIDKKAVGSRIKNIRIKNGHTLKSFGELFGARKTNVQKWEIGFTLPNKRRLGLISEYGNITVNELLYGFDKDIQRIYVETLKLSEKDRLKLVKKIMESMINEEYR